MEYQPDLHKLKWAFIEQYRKEGLSIFPVRMKEEIVGNKIFAAKSPYGGWEVYKSKHIDLATLSEKLNRCPDAGIAVVCGAISGNLEVIDIDIKHWAGIDALFFNEIRTLYPQLWDKLRIHQSASGGFHIVYRCSEPIGEGNKKLAAIADKAEAGLETRGEGGYIIMPGSAGYSVFKDEPIPALTLDERNSLIYLAKCFDRRTPKVKAVKEKKIISSVYDENPFEHFNKSREAETLLSDFGWEIEKDTSAFIHFTRPGKISGISASFIKGKCLYYIFTSSSQLEPGTTYSPSFLLSELQFNGDFRQTYQYLVNKGYGRIKAAIEKKQVASFAKSDRELPANFSVDAKREYLKTKTEWLSKYPFGTFWEPSKEDGFSINIESFLSVAYKLGFRKYNGKPCRIQLNIVAWVDDDDYYDSMKGYINIDTEQPSKEELAICNAYERFLKNFGSHVIKRLRVLEKSAILCSTKAVAYKCFLNGILKITANDIAMFDYSEFADRLIWQHEIISRNFTALTNDDVKSSLYYQFINLAVGVEENDFHLQRVLGYLAHDFKDTTSGYIVVLVERVRDPKDGGGSGKNLLCNLMRNVTTVKEVAGKQVNFNEKFLQPWNGERIYVLSDVPKYFDFDFLKNVSTNAGVLKKLFKDEITIEAEDMPKIVVLTNFSFDDSDGGLKRRIIPVEFSPFFTIKGGVDTHFGRHFTNDWDEFEFAAYDTFMVNAIQSYLQAPKLVAPALSPEGWTKRFDIEYGMLTRQFIEEKLDAFLLRENVELSLFNTWYNNYCIDNNIQKRWHLSSHKMNNALKAFCVHHNITFLPNHSVYSAGDVSKCKVFRKNGNSVHEREEEDIPF